MPRTLPWWRSAPSRALLVVSGLALGASGCGQAIIASPSPSTQADGSLAAPSGRGALGGFIPVGLASRIVIPDLAIDLPIVSSDLEPPPNYGLCDVAQYLTTFSQPGDAGATYIYAHSQAGMFLPLYEASTRDEGAALVGKPVVVYTSDAIRYSYQIFEVKPGSTDFALAENLPPGERRLVLQTSESPAGGTTNLVVAAKLIGEEPADPGEANPEPRPRECKPTDVPKATDAPIVPTAPVATRVVIEQFGIDLPIVSGDLVVAGNPEGYPLCDVAQYLTRYRQPAEFGTTYVYAHARDGMFLPLLDESAKPGFGTLVGASVTLQTEDAMRYTYEIFAVEPASTDFSLADIVAADEQRLVLQTSIGPKGTLPKLVLAARLVASRPDAPANAAPSAKPRVCA